jgi:hypothetical protein
MALRQNDNRRVLTGRWPSAPACYRIGQRVGAAGKDLR